MMRNRFLVRWLMKVIMSAVIISGEPTYPDKQFESNAIDFYPTSSHLALEMMESANRCELMPEMVKLFADQDRNYYSHRYARAMRCSGWSTNESLSCQPTKGMTFPVRVRMVYFGRWKTVDVDVHYACDFRCVQQQTDCNRLQRYVGCRCKCTNTDEKKRCRQLNTAIWDDKQCVCNCKDYNEFCTTGYRFNRAVCRCTADHMP